ncbi:hypothetical protein EVAR_79986_1 [Eumeta japonica]|uniref:Uncharacterized protein n=1 Tax=Eumeta variegata TaxID=151549 RepID=A0A4C1ZST8_EUMVA|nr:hypothetical protein EVAR_79986_1 [Eumeta japonica]
MTLPLSKTINSHFNCQQVMRLSYEIGASAFEPPLSPPPRSRDAGTADRRRENARRGRDAASRSALIGRYTFTLVALR